VDGRRFLLAKPRSMFAYCTDVCTRPGRGLPAHHRFRPRAASDAPALPGRRPSSLTEWRCSLLT
jgi:hypothetical protein